jgi:hypothetical protein
MDNDYFLVESSDTAHLRAPLSPEKLTAHNSGLCFRSGSYKRDKILSPLEEEDALSDSAVPAVNATLSIRAGGRMGSPTRACPASSMSSVCSSAALVGSRLRILDIVVLLDATS